MVNLYQPTKMEYIGANVLYENFANLLSGLFEKIQRQHGSGGVHIDNERSHMIIKGHLSQCFFSFSANFLEQPLFINRFWIISSDSSAQMSVGLADSKINCGLGHYE